MGVRTWTERQIYCDECLCHLTDYSYESAATQRKVHGIKKIDGQDLCENCKSEKQ